MRKYDIKKFLKLYEKKINFYLLQFFYKIDNLSKKLLKTIFGNC